MPFEIYIAHPAKGELKEIRVFDRRRIVDEIKIQLANEPTVSTRHRKCLGAASPEFDHLDPVWELRVGEFRVFYDVDENANFVFVRAVRRKDPELTTEEVIS